MTNKVISVASSKGGIGKSTVAIGVSRALAQSGHKVLLADLDFGNACLDLLLGVEDDVLLTPQEGVGIQRHGLGGDEELVALGTQHLVLGDGDDEDEDEVELALIL